MPPPAVVSASPPPAWSPKLKRILVPPPIPFASNGGIGGGFVGVTTANASAVASGATSAIATTTTSSTTAGSAVIATTTSSATAAGAGAAGLTSGGGRRSSGFAGSPFSSGGNVVEIASAMLSASTDLSASYCGGNGGSVPSRKNALSVSTPMAGNDDGGGKAGQPIRQQQQQPPQQMPAMSPPPLQRFVTLHPTKCLVAYVLNPAGVSIATNVQHKAIVVQNTTTKEIVFSITWMDLASALYGEADTKKLVAASKSLGCIQSLQFYDPAVVYWTRLVPSSSTSSTPAGHDRFEALAIQTDKRVVLLNLRKGRHNNRLLGDASGYHSGRLCPSPFRTILAHFCEKTIGATPSSNVLPLTDCWVLIGCIDGSMKCYDWITGTTIKKIRGLGKGDWIVKLLAANRYLTDPPSTHTASSASATTNASNIMGITASSSATVSSAMSSSTLSAAALRRIMTVTKKGIVYLIEIEIDLENNTMDIQPPLGRFYIGSPVEVPAWDATAAATATSSANVTHNGNNLNNANNANNTNTGISANSTNTGSLLSQSSTHQQSLPYESSITTPFASSTPTTTTQTTPAVPSTTTTAPTTTSTIASSSTTSISTSTTTYNSVAGGTSGSTKDAHGTIDQQPQPQNTTPGTTSGGSNIYPIMEHSIISYDPHMDRLLWLTTTPVRTNTGFGGIGSNNPSVGLGGVGAAGGVGGGGRPQNSQQYNQQLQQQTLSVWNLRSLQQDFIQQAHLASSSGSSSKNLFKPDPTLVIQFPSINTSSSSLSTSAPATVAILYTHPAFTADTVVCVTVSSTGDLLMHGAIGLAANTTQTVVATPILAINLTTLLAHNLPELSADPQQQSQSQPSDANNNAVVRVHAASSQPLPSSTSSELILATNVGLFVMELPASLPGGAASTSAAVKGTYHCHFGAGLGHVGKSILMVQHSASTVEYATVDALVSNPIGCLEPKNFFTIHDNPLPKHMPIEYQRRPFRPPPTFLTSPSGMFVCMFWPAEYRYEILHIPLVLQRVAQRSSLGSSSSAISVLASGGGSLGVGSMDPISSSNRKNAVVASGIGVADFAWVGDDDMFAVLHAEDLMAPVTDEGGQYYLDGSLSLSNYSLAPSNIRASAMNVASIATSVTKSATSGALTVTKNATSAANKTVGVATQGVRVGAKAVTNSVKKSFKILGGVTGGVKKRRSVYNTNASLESGVTSTITPDDYDDDSNDFDSNINNNTTYDNNNNNNNNDMTNPQMTPADALQRQIARSGAVMELALKMNPLITASLPVETQRQRYVVLKRLEYSSPAPTPNTSSASTTANTNTTATSSGTTGPVPNMSSTTISTSDTTSTSSAIPSVSLVSLGELTLRGGKRTRPTALFGGPVLCVACRASDDDGTNRSSAIGSNVAKDGQAYFYTRKSDNITNSNKSTNNTEGFSSTVDNRSANKTASLYVTSGPTIPYPDAVTWDDDGRLCAVVIRNRVAIYHSSEKADFVLLGTVRIDSPTTVNANITSIRFVHGALFCCTHNSVHCVLLGDIDTLHHPGSNTHGLCQLDAYLLASTDVSMLPQRLLPPLDDRWYIPFAPNPVPLPLVQPTILGYQGGSLLLSTLRGVQAVPLHCSLLRIGLLLAGGQVERATKWFDAVAHADHEALASFLERRGRPELAMSLPGLSLETIVDMCMRHGFVDRLEEVVETFGVQGLRALDQSRGLSPSIFGPDPTMAPPSLLVCVGAYLLAHGRVELTRRLATECLRRSSSSSAAMPSASSHSATSNGNYNSNSNNDDFSTNTNDNTGIKDAFALGTLLLTVDEDDANRLITRAVHQHQYGGDDTATFMDSRSRRATDRHSGTGVHDNDNYDETDHCDGPDDWLIGKFVRDYYQALSSSPPIPPATSTASTRLV